MEQEKDHNENEDSKGFLQEIRNGGRGKEGIGIVMLLFEHFSNCTIL